MSTGRCRLVDEPGTILLCRCTIDHLMLGSLMVNLPTELTATDDVLALLDRKFKRVNFCSIILNSAWRE